MPRLNYTDNFHLRAANVELSTGIAEGNVQGDLGDNNLSV